MRWIIYKHTNKINGKSYIGQTCQSPHLRWNNGKGYSRTFKFGKAIFSGMPGKPAPVPTSIHL